ncbi:MAG: hypothetical protein ACI4O9_00275 [Akkermansia sp.]
MKTIFPVIACVMLCIGSAWADADTGSLSTRGDGTALWAPPQQDEDSGLTWKQVMGIVLLCGGACGGGVLWQRARQVHIEPQPLEVQLRKDYVTRCEFDDYRKQVGDDFERVHNRLDMVMPAVAEIKGEIKHIAQTQTQILNLLLNGKASE